MSVQKKNLSTLALVVSSIGVVYGDIGTSPLYALKSCFTISQLDVTPDNVLGLVSLFCWTLFLIVSLKYVNLVMNVKSLGEGGILVLSSLAGRLPVSPRLKLIFFGLGIAGCSLFFGDAIITPAISILGAVEGLHVISDKLAVLILPVSIVILILIFMIQKEGSGRIGAFFGPIMILWFSTLTGLGIYNIILEPTSLMALNPYYALKFLLSHKIFGVLALGGTVLVVTGAEALYADMGHFGKKPVSLAWHYFVFPALTINYLGQGALLISTPSAIENPFYLLAPSFGLYPLLLLSTAATIIASQATITGIFSMSVQAIMLNYFPRLRVLYTSNDMIGQVYVPAMNFIVCVMTISAVLIFRSTENLAYAYGLNVSAVMMITTFLVFFVALKKWKWNNFKLAILFIPLFVIDLTFMLTNLVKLVEGAWYAVLMMLAVVYVIRTWITGNKVLNQQKMPISYNLKKYLNEYENKYQQRIPGTAIFMSRFPNKVPNSLVIQLHHNKFLHEKMIFVSIITTDKPRTRIKDRYLVKELNNSSIVIVAQYGFKEVPNLGRIINWATQNEYLNKEEELSFFMSKGVPVISSHAGMDGFSERLYVFLAKNTQAAYDFYRIPDDKVIELGVRYKI